MAIFGSNVQYLGNPLSGAVSFDGGPFINVQARYLLLEDHYINNALLVAGQTVTEEVEIPAGWIPTPNVDPLNTPAVTAFYSVGPTDLGLVRQQFQPIFVPKPITYWKQISPNVWQLTGLGASLAPKFAIIPHPVGNIPQ